MLSRDLRHEIWLMHRTAVGIEGGKAVARRDECGGEIEPRRSALHRNVGDADDISEVAAAGRDIAEGLQVLDHGGEHRDARLAAINPLPFDVREKGRAQAALDTIESEALPVRHPGVAGFEDGVGREGKPLILRTAGHLRQQHACRQSCNEWKAETTHGGWQASRTQFYNPSTRIGHYSELMHKDLAVGSPASYYAIRHLDGRIFSEMVVFLSGQCLGLIPVFAPRMSDAAVQRRRTVEPFKTSSPPL
ncbi:MAG: hypothetical protein K2Z25_20425 [Beijerinckiaceae bacterium]|nr:hypothetical protein [Beijerinckiaceae bacterium]